MGEVIDEKGGRAEGRRGMRGEGSHRVEALQQPMPRYLAAVLDHHCERCERKREESELYVAQPESGVGRAVGGEGPIGRRVCEILLKHHLEVDRGGGGQPARGGARHVGVRVQAASRLMFRLGLS